MRKHFTVGFAGLTIEIETVSSCVCVLCRNYLKEGKPDFKVQVTQDDVERECKLSGQKHLDKSSAELGAVYRKIAEAVLDYDMLLMHGAVIALDDAAYMFSASSGTGKTTHIRLWLNKMDNAYVVNGDKPLVQISDDNVLVCGTPWSGSEHLNTNVIKPLKAIVLLERSDNNYIEEISFSQAYPKVLEQTYIPREAEKARKALSLLLSMQGKVSFYRFHCNNYKDDCFEVAYKAITENNK